MLLAEALEETAGTPQVVTIMRLMILIGVIMVLLIAALAVVNGRQNPTQYKKDRPKKRREKKPDFGQDPDTAASAGRGGQHGTDSGIKS